MFEGVVSFNGFTWNDRSKVALNVSPFYVAMLSSVDGLWGADIDYENWPVPGVTGEKSGDVFRRGRTITLTGSVEALGLVQLRQGQRAMQQCLADRAIHNLVFQLAGEPQIYFKARVNGDLAMPEQQPDFQIKRLFTVAFRCDDPRSYQVSGDTRYPSFQEST